MSNRRYKPTGVFRTCQGCSKQFETKNTVHTYCTKKCYRTTLGLNSIPGMSPSKIGALSELIVCVDLIRKGFDVFRSESPSCPCDLVALKNNKCFRVEVKTGRKYPSGKLDYASRAIKPENFDVLAMVINGSVSYLPDLP